VRAIASRSALDLALLSAYRIQPADDDGLFLRFGGLPVPQLRVAIRELLAVVGATRT
jgi:hypothetical protein